MRFGMRSLLNHPERWLTLPDDEELSQVYMVVSEPVNFLSYTYMDPGMKDSTIDDIEWLKVPGEDYYCLSNSSKEKVLEVINSCPGFCWILFPEGVDSTFYKPYPFIYLYEKD